MNWIETERAIMIASNDKVANNIFCSCRIFRVVQIHCHGQFDRLWTHCTVLCKQNQANEKKKRMQEIQWLQLTQPDGISYQWSWLGRHQSETEVGSHQHYARRWLDPNRSTATSELPNPLLPLESRNITIPCSIFLFNARVIQLINQRFRSIWKVL